jgi:hypothetical protein
MNQIKNYYIERGKRYPMSESNKKIASYDKDFDANTSKEDLAEYGYKTLNALSTYGSRGSSAIRNYYESVKNEGYNAIVDDNNRSIYNDAVQPIIVLNANKTLKEVGVIKQDRRDMYENLGELSEYMNEKYKGKKRVSL